MKRTIRTFVLAVLFALSAGTVGVVFAQVGSAQPLLSCPTCNMIGLYCPGSTCDCNWVGPGGTDYKCQPPVK